jgi:lipid A ethanolaminephosphotransferase
LLKKLLTLRPSLRSEWLSIATAAYLLFFMNTTFWRKSSAYLAGQDFALSALAVGLLGAFAAMTVACSAKYMIKPILILMLFSASASAWFMDSFGITIDREMIRNAVETNTAEAAHLITPAFGMHMVAYALLPSILIVWIKVLHRPILRKLGVNLLVVTACLAAFSSVAILNSGTYIFTTREHRDWFPTLNPIFPIGSAVSFALKASGEQNIVVAPLGADAKVEDPLSGQNRKPRVTIIVVGETARAENFQLGGYGRETNPELSRQDIVYFSDTSSCGTATAVSLPCMFSVYGRAHYSHAKALATENLMDVLTHAGIKTEWWDNNTGDKKVADRIPKKELFRSDDRRYCQNGECLDDILLAGLDDWLDAVDTDAVLVLHQLGNHGPAYYLRYPEAYRKFTPDCRTVDFEACSKDMIVNAYDNAILYTDHIIAQVIERLKAREQALDGAMIYMSDHGESLGENGLYLHGAPYMFAPDQQTKVPFVVWTAPAFDQSIGLDKACLAGSAQAPHSHDNLFHSVLGLMQAKTKAYNSELDIFAGCTSGLSVMKGQSQLGRG